MRNRVGKDATFAAMVTIVAAVASITGFVAWLGWAPTAALFGLCATLCGVLAMIGKAAEQPRPPRAL